MATSAALTETLINQCLGAHNESDCNTSVIRLRYRTNTSVCVFSASCSVRHQQHELSLKVLLTMSLLLWTVEQTKCCTKNTNFITRPANCNSSTFSWTAETKSFLKGRKLYKLYCTNYTNEIWYKLEYAQHYIMRMRMMMVGLSGKHHGVAAKHSGYKLTTEEEQNRADGHGSFRGWSRFRAQLNQQYGSKYRPAVIRKR